MMAAVRGSDVPPERARALEERVKEVVDDASARATLLGYYFRRRHEDPAAATAFARHAGWFVENRPADRLTGSPYCSVDPVLNPDGHAALRALWEKATAPADAPVAVLMNAARFHLLPDPATAEALLARGEAADPKNSEWAAQLSHLYSLQMTDAAPAERPALAAKALAARRRAVDLATDDPGRFNELTELPALALTANDPPAAKAAAEELLRLAPQFRRSWNYGNAIHKANVALGRVALREGNVAEAKARLAAAGKTPGSPQLGSFGPNMTLAAELLDKGERQAVLEYFEACRQFWRMGGGKLDEWSADVRAGHRPDFAANLKY
jgi:hypothetical protein